MGHAVMNGGVDPGTLATYAGTPSTSLAYTGFLTPVGDPLGAGIFASTP